MRTPEEKFKSMADRGRNADQIRAVAVARGDKDLQDYCTKLAEVEGEMEDMF